MSESSNINNYREYVTGKIQIIVIQIRQWKISLGMCSNCLLNFCTQCLMKAETYYTNSKQALLINIYNNYIVDEQKMQQLMSKSRNNISNSKLDRISTFSSDNEGIDVQTWNISSNSLRFSIQSSGFILQVKSIQCIDNELVLLGSFSYINGKSLIIPAVFKTKFLEIANKNAQNLQFFTQQGRNQLLLKCSILFDYNFSTADKINQCASTITAGLPNFQKALQVVGLYHKFNKISYKSKVLQLKLKKSIVDSLMNNNLQQDIRQASQVIQQNSSVIRVKNIIQNSQKNITGPSTIIKKGGYFQVQRRESIIFRQEGNQQKKQLAWKTPLNFGAKQHIIEAKMGKQIQLVQQITNPRHLLTYYISQSQSSTIYMDYAPESLKEHIYKKDTSFQQLLNYSDQLVSAVNSIHQSGIVHRDLKPQNILVKQGVLKVIDYAQSSRMDQPFIQSHYLGCTIPYSPVECALKKEQGFNKRQIDLWSIAIILYQMAFKSIPLAYSHIIGPQILQQWRQGTQFSIFPVYRKRKGLLNTQTIISLCSMRGIKVKPSQRLSLKTYERLLSHLKHYHESLINI